MSTQHTTQFHAIHQGHVDDIEKDVVATLIDMLLMPIATADLANKTHREVLMERGSVFDNTLAPAFEAALVELMAKYLRQTTGTRPNEVRRIMFSYAPFFNTIMLRITTDTHDHVVRIDIDGPHGQLLVQRAADNGFITEEDLDAGVLTSYFLTNVVHVPMKNPKVAEQVNG